MSAYTDNQQALAASPGGRVAARMFSGTRWRTDGGAIATVWLGWLPDMDGRAEAAAERYRWPFSPTGHNTEIGVSIGHHTERVPVAAVANWTEVP